MRASLEVVGEKAGLCVCLLSRGDPLVTSRTRNTMSIFRTKSVEQSIRETDEPDDKLRRDLSALDLTVFGVGVIIGTGIFVLTGKVAKENAGRRWRCRSWPPASPARSPPSVTPSSPRPSRWPARPTPSPTPRSASYRPGSSAGTSCWSWRSAPRRWRSAGRATRDPPRRLGDPSAVLDRGGGRHVQRARDADRPGGHRTARLRREDLLAGQRRDRRHQDRGGAARHHRRPVLHQGRQLPPVHPARRLPRRIARR